MSQTLPLVPPVEGITLTAFVGPAERLERDGTRKMYQLTGPDGFVQVSYAELVTIVATAALYHTGIDPRAL